MRQNFRESDRFDPLDDVYILRGREAILETELLLQQLAERCGQPGAMHWLGYFLGGAGARWKHPFMVLFLKPGADAKAPQPGDLEAAALFYELRVMGIRTGAFFTDDWEGFRTVIAPAASRGHIAARAVHALVERGAQIVLTTYRSTPLEEESASMMLQRRDVLWTEHARELTRHRLMLEPTYEETLARFGKRTRVHLRYYRKRFLAKRDCEFIEDARAVVSEADAMRLTRISLNPVPDEECKRRFRAGRDLPGGFLMALRGPGEACSPCWVGGGREPPRFCTTRSTPQALKRSRSVP